MSKQVFLSSPICSNQDLQLVYSFPCHGDGFLFIIFWPHAPAPPWTSSLTSHPHQSLGSRLWRIFTPYLEVHMTSAGHSIQVQIQTPSSLASNQNAKHLPALVLNLGISNQDEHNFVPTLPLKILQPEKTGKQRQHGSGLVKDGGQEHRKLQDQMAGALTRFSLW